MFAHDTQVALQAVVGLVNASPDPPFHGGSHGGARLGTPADLDAFLDEHRFTGPRVGTGAELGEVLRLREQLIDLWQLAAQAADEAAVRVVNGMLRSGRALPQLVRHDDLDWHIHATPLEAPLPQRMAAEAAMALVDVIRMGGLQRLRRCAGADCSAVFVDFSRNGRRRFCDDSGCANRAHAAAYRARRRSG
ncbi:MAG TPA: CGNR zinc finger domain-containing protein [Dermatophilaceae bacterium]|nr:CGNR zinc finger domain-containing protein [Dermatophilaceae bacterium]